MKMLDFFENWEHGYCNTWDKYCLIAFPFNSSFSIRMLSEFISNPEGGILISVNAKIDTLLLILGEKIKRQMQTTTHDNTTRQFKFTDPNAQ